MTIFTKEPSFDILKKRFGYDIRRGNKVEIIDYIIHDNGALLYNIENKIKAKIPSDLRVKKGEVQIKSGYSEMFKENFINNLKEYKEIIWNF